jgi:anaerobic magnesium-protoporphyrin IX monomethyl ester cyclase
LYAEVEERFLTDLPWESSTDRDIDFRRTYNRKYYDHVIQMITSEVSYHKALKTPGSSLLSLTRLKLRSAWARRGMLVEQMKGIKP